MRTPARHGRPMELVSRPLDHGDMARDLAAVAETDWQEDCPLLLKRWSARGWRIPRGIVPSDKYRQRKRDSDGLRRDLVDFGFPEEPIADQTGRRIRDGSQDRFGHLLLDIKCDMEPLESAIDLIRGDKENGIEPLFAEYGRNLADGSTETRCTEVFCEAVTRAGKVIVNKGYGDLFRANGRRHLARNPAIKINVKHDADDWEYKEDSIGPDFVILDAVTDDSKTGSANWGSVIATGVTSKDQGSDMRTIGDDGQTSALRILKHQKTTARNHPVTGRTCGLTLTGRFLRMHVSDSLSYATSQLCDLLDPVHAEDIVKILAFFMGNIHEIIDTYSPPIDTFEIIPPGRTQAEVWEWCPAPESSQENAEKPQETQDMPYQMLEVRNQLWGKRTAVFAGHARKQDDPSERIYPIVIKCAWLPAYLKDYESRILHHILAALEEPHTAYPFLAEAKAKVDPQVIECIPKPLGSMQHCGRRSRAVPSVLGNEDGLEGSGDHHLELSVLVTTSPHGERIPSRPSDLSLRDHFKILRGCAETLWIASCCGVHYRDINLGNILYHRSGSQITGYLIDWGNARILEERRKRIPHPSGRGRSDTVNLCLDDARSINTLFVCTQLAETLALASECDDAEEDLKLMKLRHRKRRQKLGHEKDSEEEDSGISELRHSQEKILDQISKHKHRYIDDLESLLYAFCYWLARIAGTRHGERSKVFRLGDMQLKKRQWNNTLFTIIDEILITPDLWSDLLQKLAEKTRLARKTIGQGIPSEMSEAEKECFEGFVDLLLDSEGDSDSDKRLTDVPLGSGDVGWVSDGPDLGSGRERISGEGGPTSKRTRLI